MLENCYYDGRPRVDLIPINYLKSHSQITKSPIIYKKYPTLDGRYEDCEHRLLHIMAYQKNKAKIRIAPDPLFI